MGAVLWDQRHANACRRSCIGGAAARCERTAALPSASQNCPRERNSFAGDDVLSRLRTVPMGPCSSGTALIAINGWIASRSDFVSPFDTLDRRQGAHKAEHVGCMPLYAVRCNT